MCCGNECRACWNRDFLQTSSWDKGANTAAGGEGSEHKAGKFAGGRRMEVHQKHEAALQLSTGLLDHCCTDG